MLRKLLIIICLLSTVSLTYGQKKKKRNKKEDRKTEAVANAAAPAVADSAIDYKVPGSPMPDIRFIRKDGKIITHRNLDNKSNVFIMMYNPTCEHCQEQAQVLIKNLKLFDKTKLMFFAAPNMEPYFSFFEAVTHVERYPKIEVGLDSGKFIDKTFLYQSLPQINIYNKDRKLIKVFTGETPIDSLKPYID